MINLVRIAISLAIGIEASQLVDYRQATNDIPPKYAGKLSKQDYFYSNSSYQTSHAPSRQFDNLIFEDNFDDFNLKTWKHDITLGGGGNWEFEFYTNNRSSSFVKEGNLHIRPILTSESIGEAAVVNGGTLDLWGNQPNMKCTANAFYGCMRTSNGNNYLNPIQSALLRSHEKLSFTYGKVEIRARLPKGDWIWPAIWLLPIDHNYGSWPASGEIDLVESRGNDPSYPGKGRDTFASTLHWGPSFEFNRYQTTSQSYTLPNGQSFSDDFHIFTLEWTGDSLKTFVDNNPVLTVNYDVSYWDRGRFPAYLNNPWQERPKAAPFDRDFYLIFNVAVGGTNGYFPEGVGNKPWGNQSPIAMKEFWDKRNEWYPTWPQDDRRDLIIDYVKVYSA